MYNYKNVTIKPECSIISYYRGKVVVMKSKSYFVALPDGLWGGASSRMPFKELSLHGHTHAPQGEINHDTLVSVYHSL